MARRAACHRFFDRSDANALHACDLLLAQTVIPDQVEDFAVRLGQACRHLVKFGPLVEVKGLVSLSLMLRERHRTPDPASIADASISASRKLSRSGRPGNSG